MTRLWNKNIQSYISLMQKMKHQLHELELTDAYDVP